MFCRHLLGLILAAASAVFAQGEPVVRKVDMGVYSVLTDTKKSDELSDWITKFELNRRAIQHLTGITDEQVQPLTILLFEKREDFRALLQDYRTTGPGSFYVNTRNGPEIRVMTAGMAQQPMLALSLQGRSKDDDLKARAALSMWLLSSAGIVYDSWVLQGFFHILEESKIEAGGIVLPGVIKSLRSALRSRMAGSHKQEFDLNRYDWTWPVGLPWISVNYLTSEQGVWLGLGKLKDYQQRKNMGESPESAFAHAVGMTVPVFDGVLKNYIKRGKIVGVTVPFADNGAGRSIEIRPAEPGLWKTMTASFRLLQNPHDRAQGLRLIQEAIELMPKDPRPYEALWIYAESEGPPQLAYDALKNAVVLGSKNNYIGTQWAIQLINRSIMETQGLDLRTADARRAADVFAGIASQGAGSLATYRLLACLMPAIHPAQENHRRILEQGLQTSYEHDQLIALGLVAWHWRNTDLIEARKQFDGLTAESSKDPFVSQYARWLRFQLDLNEKITRTEAAIAKGDFDQAAAIFSEAVVEPSTARFLKQSYDKHRVVLDYYKILLRVGDFLKVGKKAGAKVLLEGIDENSLPEKLLRMKLELESALANS